MRVATIASFWKRLNHIGCYANSENEAEKLEVFDEVLDCVGEKKNEDMKNYVKQNLKLLF